MTLLDHCPKFCNSAVSTTFGNSSDDIHQNTGSVYMDGLSAQALGNAQTITKDTILRENHNAVLYGPITIDASFTINLGSKVKIKDFDELEQYILHKLFILDTLVKENLKNYNFHKLYKELSNFCALDLSSFYFDIRKDVLYCDSLESKKRKDCVIVLNIILECLLKWFAPIFVFTTDEIYSLVSKDNRSIHEYTFLKIPKEWSNKDLDEKWKKLFKIKQEANIAIEEKRSNKEIGSSLEAEIKITVDGKNFALLDGLDLAEYFITSKAQKIKGKDKEFKIEVSKTNGVKCPRCWKILENKCERCENMVKSST